MIPIRALYLPIHMHNHYNVRPTEEIIRILEDQYEWGYNTLVLWYNVDQYNDPFAEVEGNEVARTEWDKQRRLAERAKALGMGVWMISTANVIYANQAASDPGLVATVHPQSDHTPQHVCPSNPQAREFILSNHDRIFAELPGLSAFIDFAYDWGGCGCEKCAPWANTYYDLLREKAELLRRHVPDGAVYLCDWHFTDEEVALLAGRIASERPGWLTGAVKDDRHPIDRWATRGLPPEYPVLSFFDVTMIGGWGTLGAQPFPERIARLCRELRDNDIGGMIVYTEGIWDGANRALAASLTQTPDAEPQAILERYAGKYFGFHGEKARALAEALALCEQDFTMPMNPWCDQRFVPDKERAAAIIATIRELDGECPPKARGHWEWQSIVGRADIEELLLVVGTRDSLRAAVLQQVRMILDAQRADTVGDFIARARVILYETATALEKLKARVVDLRERVYQEPEDKFPAMAVDAGMFEGRWGNTSAEYQETHKELAEQLRHLEACTTVEMAREAAGRMVALEEQRGHDAAPVQEERWGAGA